MKRDMEDILLDLIDGDIDMDKAKEELLFLNSVSEMFEFAGYLYGNFDYHDNTKDGDIYIHNDNGLKYTRDKIYQQWIGIRNYR